MKRAICLISVLFIILTATACNKEVIEVEELPGTRYPNVDNITVTSTDGTWKVDGGKIFVDDEEIEVGDLKPAEVTSLSIVDDCVYVHGEEGLQRYNLTKKSTELLYYDIMDFSFVGLLSMYYVSNSDLYKMEFSTDSVIISPQVTKDVYLLNGNSFYYVASDTVKSIDLITDKMTDLKTLTSPVKGLSLAGDTLTVETVDGSVPIKVTDKK